jgi:serine/threonine-protein phosphatase 2A regulatory subunit B
MYECSRENAKLKQLLKPKRVLASNVTQTSAIPSQTKRNQTGSQNNKKDEICVDNLDFTKKILHTSWHPKENIIAIAATNNLYIFNSKDQQLSAVNTPCTTSNSVLQSTSSMFGRLVVCQEDK